MSWTDERMEMLKSMWEAGHSSVDIAKALGGVTRNAVMGKINRMGLMGSLSHNTNAAFVAKGACRPIVVEVETPVQCPVPGTLARVRARLQDPRPIRAAVAMSFTSDLVAGKYDPTRPAHRASLVGISTILAKGDPRKILVPAMPEPAVLGIMRTLATNGIVVGGKTPATWNDDEAGDAAFFEDMLRVEAAA